MILRSVAFMHVELVIRVLLARLKHMGITGRFGKDRGSRDGGTFRIAIDHRGAGTKRLRQSIAINEKMIRRDAEPLHRTSHGEKSRLQNIDLIDFIRVGFCHAPYDERTRSQLTRHLVTLASGHLLGISQ